MELLEKHFDIAFAAPDGIKRLRELILTLAMQGKLVPQDSNDQPARKLLQEIEAEKKRLVKAGKIKVLKSLPAIRQEEVPYELPQGWEWVRFGEIAQHNSGKTLDKGRNTGQLREYITTSNLYWGYFELVNLRQMPIRDEELEKCTARKGDLLLCEGGEAGRAAVWNYDTEVCFQNHVHRARFYCDVDPYFAYRFFEKLNATGEIKQHRKGVGISNMSSKALASIVFPLPPLVEQCRIVARIDQLMARCDELEKLRAEREQKRLGVHTAALNRLLAEQDADSFTDAWQFITRHFGELYSNRDNVVELRKAVLQLAVMGKLVPQDPNEKPVSELLMELEVEKMRLVKAGKIKAPKPLPKISPREIPYELPPGWEWVRLDEVIVSGPTNGFSPKTVSYETPIRSLSLSATTSGVFKGEYSKFVDWDIPSDSYLWLRDGDILIQRGNTLEYVGVPAVYRGESNQFIYPDLMMRIRVSENINTDYIHLALSAETSRNFLRSSASGTSGTMPKINQAALRSLPIPISPLTEQRRIVAKINQLMALCDELDRQIIAASDRQATLLNAVMAQV